MSERLKELAAQWRAKKNTVIQVTSPEFPKQDAFVQDKSRFITALCTRRAGKTNGLALRFFNTLQKYPGCFCPYIALTRESARNIMWGILQEQSEKYKLKAIFTESNLTMTMGNGSRLQLFGADMKNFIKRLKGIKTPGAAIDECFHPDTLVETIIGEKRISDLKVGDFVLNAVGYGRVTNISRKAVASRRSLVYNNRRITCSDNHPFFTLRGWVKASELKVGDHLARQS